MAFGDRTSTSFKYIPFEGEVPDGLRFVSGTGTEEDPFVAEALYCYELRFIKNNGEEDDVQTVENGILIEEPDAPEKEGYVFGGWYREEECQNPWDFAADTIAEDTTLYAYWIEVTEPVIGEAKPEFKTHSLNLGGKIGVNFFMDLPVIDGVDYSGSKVVFTVNGKETVAAYDENSRNEAGTYFKFTCLINAIQMAEKIHAVFHYSQNGEDKTVDQYYSAEDYIVQGAEDERLPEEARTLIKALADFGYYAQIYLASKRDWELGKDYAAMSANYTTFTEEKIQVIQDAVAGYSVAKSINEDIEKVSFSLVFDTETAINLYVQPKAGYSGKLTAKVDSVSVKVAKSGSQKKIAIPDLPPTKLDEMHSVEITTSSGKSEMELSALSYVRALLDASSDTHARNAMAAVYRYYEAAEAYAD